MLEQSEPEAEGTTLYSNAGNCLPKDTAWYPRKFKCSAVPL